MINESFECKDKTQQISPHPLYKLLLIDKLFTCYHFVYNILLLNHGHNVII